MRRILAWIAPLVLAACGHMASTDAPVPTSARTAESGSRAEELVAYLGHLRGMNESALEAEVARQRRQGTDPARVKAALALCLSAQAEESEILALVDPVVRRGSADPGTQAMAGFLQGLANERRRLKENAVAAGTRLKEERRALEAQKQRAEALQQKLDALTELEKSLSDRPPSSR